MREWGWLRGGPDGFRGHAGLSQGSHGADVKLILHSLPALLCGYVTAAKEAGIHQPLAHLLPLFGDGDWLQRHSGLWP